MGASMTITSVPKGGRVYVGNDKDFIKLLKEANKSMSDHIKKLQVDVDRYRYLREKGCGMGVNGFVADTVACGPSLDEEVDRRMGKK